MPVLLRDSASVCPPTGNRSTFPKTPSLVRDLNGSPTSVLSLIPLQTSDQKLFDGFSSRGCRTFVIANMWASFDAWIMGDIVGFAGFAVFDQTMFTLFQLAIAGSSALSIYLGFSSEEEKIVTVLSSGVFGKGGVHSRFL